MTGKRGCVPEPGLPLQVLPKQMGVRAAVHMAWGVCLAGFLGAGSEVCSPGVLARWLPGTVGGRGVLGEGGPGQPPPTLRPLCPLSVETAPSPGRGLGLWRPGSTPRRPVPAQPAPVLGDMQTLGA